MERKSFYLSGQKKDEEVIINIALMEWSEKEQELKPKRGKKLPLRIPRSANYSALLRAAKEKWKNFQKKFIQWRRKISSTIWRYKQSTLLTWLQGVIFLAALQGGNWQRFQKNNYVSLHTQWFTVFRRWSRAGCRWRNSWKALKMC